MAAGLKVEERASRNAKREREREREMSVLRRTASRKPHCPALFRCASRRSTETPIESIFRRASASRRHVRWLSSRAPKQPVHSRRSSLFRPRTSRARVAKGIDNAPCVFCLFPSIASTELPWRDAAYGQIGQTLLQRQKFDRRRERERTRRLAVISPMRAIVLLSIRLLSPPGKSALFSVSNHQLDRLDRDPIADRVARKRQRKNARSVVFGGRYRVTPRDGHAHAEFNRDASRECVIMPRPRNGNAAANCSYKYRGTPFSFA